MDIITSNSPKNQLPLNQVLIGHCLEVLKGLPDNSVHCCVTSPPYWGLRSYGIPSVHWPTVTFSPMPGLPEITIPEQDADLGLEPSLWAYTGHMVSIFREVYRVLRKDGTLWLNLGDTYITSPPGNNGKHNNLGDGAYKRRQDRQLGHGEDMQAIYQKPKELKMKDLAMIPARVALALQADGWYLRADCPWLKANAMPESIRDRPAKGTENIFLLSKSEHYYFDAEAVKKSQSKTTFDRFGNGTPRKKAVKLGGSSRQNETFDNPLGILPNGRNRRNTDWFYESLDEAIAHLTAIRDSGGMLLSEDGPEALLVNPAAYKAAHFATFPEKLITPMILASTSEHGTCGNCGGQWVREVEKEVNLEPGRNKVGLGPKTLDNPMTQNGKGGSTLHHTVEKVTTGWRPSCQCNAPVVPAIVLDPFGGSGTTGKVSLANRRDFILIDANPVYAEELTPERLNGTQIKLMEAPL